MNARLHNRALGNPARRPRSALFALLLSTGLVLGGCCGAVGRGADDLPEPPGLTVPDLYAPTAEADAGPAPDDGGTPR